MRKLIIYLLVALSLSSCVNTPMQRYLKSKSTVANDEMIGAIERAANDCGFSDIHSQNFPSGAVFVYFYARTNPPKLEISLLKILNKEEMVIVLGEANYERGINEGFTESDLEQFGCFENKLRERLPDAFEWR